MMIFDKFDNTNEQVERHIGPLEFFTKAEIRSFFKINTTKRGEDAARLFFGSPQTSDNSGSILYQKVQNQITITKPQPRNTKHVKDKWGENRKPLVSSLFNAAISYHHQFLQTSSL